MAAPQQPLAPAPKPKVLVKLQPLAESKAKIEPHQQESLLRATELNLQPQKPRKIKSRKVDEALGCVVEDGDTNSPCRIISEATGGSQKCSSRVVQNGGFYFPPLTVGSSFSDSEVESSFATGVDGI